VKTPVLLELSKITKTFPGVKANNDISFSIKPGEIHALLGENGAGKSTLVKIIYGIMQPDHGQMFIGKKLYKPSEPFEARANGIGMVFQHFSLFEALTVAENIELGINKEAASKDLNRQISEISETYGLPVDPIQRIGSLSVGECQRVEVVRCLLQKPRLLIMDEPTSVLTPQESHLLFQTLTKLSQDGCSILYISHKLEEIRMLCERATVLRDGKVVSQCSPREESARSLAQMMIGSNLKTPQPSKPTFGEKRLSVNGLSINSTNPLGTNLCDLAFEVRAGEILGIAGVAGNGQTELFEVLSGERPVDKNMVQLDHRLIGHEGPTKRRELGMCCIPEERVGHAVVPDMSLWENCILSARTRQKLERSGFLNIPASHKFAEKIVENFNVKTPSVKRDVRSLSGGNLQKFIVGREMLQNPRILLIMQPTWGVDAAAAADIHFALNELAETGTAILAISQDLDELIAISNSFAVISEGRLSEPRPTVNVTIEEIGLLMGKASHLEENEQNDPP